MYAWSSPQYSAQSMKNLPSIPGRMEEISSNCLGRVFIDYAHTPDAYEKLFSNLATLFNDNTIYVIFGCGGDRDKSKRKKMAAIAEQYAAFCLVTTDNPRTENLDAINENIISGFSGNNYRLIPDRRKAIHVAMGEMTANSMLFVLGKGRETYQEIGSERIFYSDIESIKEFSHAD